MGLALPTAWVIQLVCRVSFETPTTSLNVPTSPEPLHQLDCLYEPHNRTTTDANDYLDTAVQNVTSILYDQHIIEDQRQHRLYYRCIFEEKERKTENRIADCSNTNPPLPLFTNDTRSFDLEQEFPRNVSLNVEDLTTDSSTATTLFVTPPSTSAVWLTLPKFPYFNETSFQSVRLKCERYRDNEARILCVLDTYPPLTWTYLLAVIAIGGGGLGNILVCLAVCLDRSLQNVTNYFLLSLAVADLLVCLFVMPLGAIQGFFGYWPFGMVWCNAYLSCDVLACSCSIMHMCFISLGRYIGIRNPLKTRQSYSTKRLVGIKIAIVWTLSLMVGGWITFLGFRNPINIMPEPDHCLINNQTFAGLGSVVAFYLPMVVMVCTYVRTVQLLRKKARFLQQKPGSEHEGPTFRRLGGRFRKPPPSARNSPTTPISPDDGRLPPPKASLSTSRRWRTTVIPRTTNKNAILNTSSSQPSLIGGSAAAARGNSMASNGTRRLMDSAENVYMNNQSDTESVGGKNPRSRTLRLPLNVTPSSLSLRFLASRTKRRDMATAANVVRTEQKASKVLGLVFVTFVFCWAPFFLLNVYFVFCPLSKCSTLPGYVGDLALWLGYISSTINPIIYTIFNRNFRAAFSRLLKCKCKRMSRPPRYRSVNENRNSTLMLAQTPSSAAAGAATVPLSLSLQGTPLMTPSSASSFLTSIRSPVLESCSETNDPAESSTTA